MKVLVTGATGFVGSWMTKKLVTEGLDVHILRRSSSDLSELINIDVTHHIGDVTDPESLVQAIKQVDVVFHLAGVVGYTPSARKLMEKVNIGGTQNVVEACIKLDIKRLVYMSSVVAIGASFNGQNPLNEQSEYNLEHLNLGYFQTKHEAEKIVKQACEKNQIDAVILNPSTIYGPGDAKKGSRKTQVKVAQGKMPFYTSGGVNVIHIKDLVDAVYQAFQVGKTGERYILAGENLTIKQLFNYIAEAAGVKPPSIYMPDIVLHTIGKIGDILERSGKKAPLSSENAWAATLFHWFDSSKAQKDLNLTITPAKEAITSSVNWMKTNNII